jgi:uncharacterized protein HemX
MNPDNGPNDNAAPSTRYNNNHSKNGRVYPSTRPDQSLTAGHNGPKAPTRNAPPRPAVPETTQSLSPAAAVRLTKNGRAPFVISKATLAFILVALLIVVGAAVGGAIGGKITEDRKHSQENPSRYKSSSLCEHWPG